VCSRRRCTTRRRGNESAVSSRVYTPTRPRRGLAARGRRRLHASCFEGPRGLVQKVTSPLRPQPRFRVVADRDAHRLTAPDPVSFSPTTRVRLTPQRGNASSFEEASQVADQAASHCRTNELAGPRPARAAMENVGDDLGLSSEPEKQNYRSMREVTSPNLAARHQPFAMTVIRVTPLSTRQQDRQWRRAMPGRSPLRFPAPGKTRRSMRR
jgi:hypothetical protein